MQIINLWITLATYSNLIEFEDDKDIDTIHYMETIGLFTGLDYFLRNEI